MLATHGQIVLPAREGLAGEICRWPVWSNDGERSVGVLSIHHPPSQNDVFQTGAMIRMVMSQKEGVKVSRARISGDEAH